jgi:hypothetical protein
MENEESIELNSFSTTHIIGYDKITMRGCLNAFIFARQSPFVKVTAVYISFIIFVLIRNTAQSALLLAGYLHYKINVRYVFYLKLDYSY